MNTPSNPPNGYYCVDQTNGQIKVVTSSKAFEKNADLIALFLYEDKELHTLGISLKTLDISAKEAFLFAYALMEVLNQYPDLYYCQALNKEHYQMELYAFLEAYIIRATLMPEFGALASTKDFRERFDSVFNGSFTNTKVGWLFKRTSATASFSLDARVTLPHHTYPLAVHIKHFIDEDNDEMSAEKMLRTETYHSSVENLLRTGIYINVSGDYQNSKNHNEVKSLIQEYIAMACEKCGVIFHAIDHLEGGTPFLLV